MARPRRSQGATRGCTAISGIATGARSEMMPVQRDNARSHVTRSPSLVLHCSEVKEIHCLRQPSVDPAARTAEKRVMPSSIVLSEPYAGLQAQAVGLAEAAGLAPALLSLQRRHGGIGEPEAAHGPVVERQAIDRRAQCLGAAAPVRQIKRQDAPPP